MNVRAVVAGLVLGLVFGAGIASLVWALVSDSGGNDDVAAVCGVVERTPLPDEHTPVEDMRRWSVGEVMPSVVKDSPQYQPLADAMDDAVKALRSLDLDKMLDAVDRAKAACADA